MNFPSLGIEAFWLADPSLRSSLLFWAHQLLSSARSHVWEPIVQCFEFGDSADYAGLWLQLLYSLFASRLSSLLHDLKGLRVKEKTNVSHFGYS